MPKITQKKKSDAADENPKFRSNGAEKPDGSKTKNWYIEQRNKNLARNLEILKSLGLQEVEHHPPNSAWKRKPTVKKRPSVVRRPPSIVKYKAEGAETSGSERKSLRLEGKPVIHYDKFEGYYNSADDSDSDFEGSSGPLRKRLYQVGNGKIDTSLYKYQKPTEQRPNVIGAIPGVPVGQVFISRMEANYAGVHRPPVAGISGDESVGVWSICMSGTGEYYDDVDCGEVFTYTGCGGRDLSGTKSKPKNLRTAAQTTDQELTGKNLALSRNVETGNPVRVMRGYKLDSEYAPDYGFRYDGLYTVEKFWREIGLSGFAVYKYAFKRLPNQEPPPWEAEPKLEEDEDLKQEELKKAEREIEPQEEEEPSEEPTPVIVNQPAAKGRRGKKKAPKDAGEVEPQQEEPSQEPTPVIVNQPAAKGRRGKKKNETDSVKTEETKDDIKSKKVGRASDQKQPTVNKPTTTGRKRKQKMLVPEEESKDSENEMDPEDPGKGREESKPKKKPGNSVADKMLKKVLVPVLNEKLTN